MSRIVKEFAGKYAGPGHESQCKVAIESGHKKNGSGPQAFGGADTWPCLKVDINFQTGDEQTRDRLEKKLIDFLKQYGVITGDPRVREVVL